MEINDNHRFAHNIILINGGTSGIGLETALQFAVNGAHRVIVTGRSESKWLEAQRYLQVHLSDDQKKVIEYMPCDVRVEQQVADTIKTIFKKYGRLDVCFNNAGVQPGVVSGPDSGYIGQMQFESSIDEDGSILYRLPAPQPVSSSEYTDKDINSNQATATSPFCESELATSCFGVFYSLKWQIELIFLNQPRDIPVSIINTASRNGVLPDAHRPLYAASKAFIIALTKSVANQVAQKCRRENRQMIRVNVISPGPVDTPLEFAAFGINPEDKSQYSNYVKAASTGVPLHRTALPKEIAPSVLFLADPKTSSYITGANLCVDGGHTGSPLLCPCS